MKDKHQYPAGATDTDAAFCCHHFALLCCLFIADQLPLFLFSQHLLRKAAKGEWSLACWGAVHMLGRSTYPDLLTSCPASDWLASQEGYRGLWKLPGLWEETCVLWEVGPGLFCSTTPQGTNGTPQVSLGTHAFCFLTRQQCHVETWKACTLLSHFKKNTLMDIYYGQRPVKQTHVKIIPRGNIIKIFRTYLQYNLLCQRCGPVDFGSSTESCNCVPDSRLKVSLA